MPRSRRSGKNGCGSRDSGARTPRSRILPEARRIAPTAAGGPVRYPVPVGPYLSAASRWPRIVETVWTVPSAPPGAFLEQPEVPEELERRHGRLVECELEVDVPHGLPEEPRERVDLLVVHGEDRERAHGRGELERLPCAEGRHGLVRATPPNLRRRQGLLDEP